MYIIPRVKRIRVHVQANLFTLAFQTPLLQTCLHPHVYNACVIHPMQTHAIHPLCMRNTTVTKKGIMWRWKPNIFFPTIQEHGMVNDSIETIQIKGLIAYKYKNKMSAHFTNRAVV